MDFTFITDFFGRILDKINTLVTFFGDLVKAVFLAAVNLFKDFLCMFADMLASVVTAALSGIEALVPSGVLSTWAGYWSAIPSGMLDVLIAIGIVPVFAIISSAIAIRLVLQLIPFVRLGS